MSQIQKKMTMHDFDFLGKIGLRKENPTEFVYGDKLRVSPDITKEEYDALPDWKKSHNFVRLLQCAFLTVTTLITTHSTPTYPI